MEKTKIIVTGIGGNVGQGILRNIRDSFPDLYLIGLDIADFTSGNYLCNCTYKVPNAVDQNFIPAIQQIIDHEKGVDLIIPSTDYEVYYLSLNKNLISAPVAASDANITKIYLDKYESFLHHHKEGIPFAQSWLPSEYDFSQTEIIAKPREGRGSRGILLNPPSPKDLSDDYLIQSLVKGKEITSAVYVTRNNEVHGIFTMERKLVNGTTSQAKVVFEYDEKVKMIVDRMVAFGGLKGSFNVQSIVNENGDVIPFEINCRISGTNSIRHNLGFQDVKYTIQELLLEINPDQPRPIPGVATRILLDVVYPNMKDENSDSTRNVEHIIY